VFRINPHTLYSREDLERELQGLMDVATFLQRINPRKRYKAAWWGEDLIAALNAQPPEERRVAMSSRLAARRKAAVRQGTRCPAPGLEPIELSEDTIDVLDSETP